MARRAALNSASLTTRRTGFCRMCWSLGRATGYQPNSSTKHRAASLSGARKKASSATAA